MRAAAAPVVVVTMADVSDDLLRGSAKWSRGPRPAPTSCCASRYMAGWPADRRALVQGVPQPHGGGHPALALRAAHARSDQQLQGLPPRLPAAHADRERGGIRAGAGADGQGPLRRRPRRGSARDLERAHGGREPVPSVLLVAALPALVLLGAHKARRETSRSMTAATRRSPSRSARRRRAAVVASTVWFSALAIFAVWTRLPMVREGLWRDEAISVSVATRAECVRAPRPESRLRLQPAAFQSSPVRLHAPLRVGRDSAQALRAAPGPARPRRSDGARLGARRSRGGRSDRRASASTIRC